MINSRDNDVAEISGGIYNILYHVGECLEKKDNPEELIRILGYYIDKSGAVAYINHNIYNSNMKCCETIGLEELNANWIKTSKMIISSIPNNSKCNIGLSKIIDANYGHLEISDKGISLVKRK